MEACDDVIYFGNMGYDGYGIVVDWGDANHLIVLDPSDSTTTPAWKVIRVHVYKKFSMSHSDAHEDRWVYSHEFSVSHWKYIGEVYDRFYACCGVYKRISFFVETFLYTEEQGWKIYHAHEDFTTCTHSCIITSPPLRPLTYFGRLGYNSKGKILEWCDPNDSLPVEIPHPEPLCCNAAAWKLLHVIVYNRNLLDIVYVKTNGQTTVTFM